jgi:hypothetical protein
MGNLRSFRRKLGGGAKRLPERMKRRMAAQMARLPIAGRLSREQRRKAGAAEGMTS